MAKRYDAQQWNTPDVDPVIRIEELAEAATSFPHVSEPCGGCNGQGRVALHTGTPTRVVHHACDVCSGTGRTMREMDAREEHYYIMHLLTKKGLGR